MKKILSFYGMSTCWMMILVPDKYPNRVLLASKYIHVYIYVQSSCFEPLNLVVKARLPSGFWLLKMRSSRVGWVAQVAFKSNQVSQTVECAARNMNLSSIYFLWGESTCSTHMYVLIHFNPGIGKTPSRHHMLCTCTIGRESRGVA